MPMTIFNAVISSATNTEFSATPRFSLRICSALTACPAIPDYRQRRTEYQVTRVCASAICGILVC